jgi:uncharacterized membrane protein
VLVAEHLERHHAVERRLQRLVDLAHTAAADQLDDPVAIVDPPAGRDAAPW